MHLSRALIPALSRRRALAGLAVLNAGPWLALPAGAATRPAPGLPPLPELPPMALRERRLGNGLQVVSLPDARSATVSVQVWYRVGGKDDPPGRSGFAHLFEHLMFKRTRHMPDEMFDRLTEDVGGQNNAFTADDMTVYQNEVPSNHLERLLWAEAERMANLDVDQANFDSERKVVIEELRQSVLADPYGRLFEALPRHGFEQHPYQRAVIGNEAELNAATLEDVRRFHRTYYRPDNAMLVVVGEFDPAQLDAWVDRYFGPLRAPAEPVPRVQVTELPRRADARVTLRAPNVPLPAVALLWKGPPAAHADASALTVAAALLSGGDSSRLNEAIVYRARAAQSAGLMVELYADAGLLAAYAIASHGQPTGRLEKALLGEITRLADGPLPAAELDKVRTRLLTQALVARQTPLGQAQAIGMAALLQGSVAEANRALQRLQAVQADDVRRVLRHWVLGTRRMTLTYLNQAGA